MKEGEGGEHCVRYMSAAVYSTLMDINRETIIGSDRLG